MEITIEKLKSAGFVDQTGGWGGSQGSDHFYRLQKGKIDITLQTYDSDNYWHLEYNFDVIFKTTQDLDDYCREKFGEAVFLNCH
jgi:hypothetical protein